MADAALRFGRYEALFRIASGGMAEVFAARVRAEGGFEKLVAVKRMLPHLADDPQFVRMFLDEARVAATLASPNVVQTLDVGRTDDGAPYIVMELVVGLSLAELLPLALKSEAGLPMAVCAEIVWQTAKGLHDAHEARTAAGAPLGLVHRDVSPQNILIARDGWVRVTDFGIARVTQDRLAQTEHGVVKGKLGYFSPEQARNEPLDRRSDVFALGIVAWEMLAGRRLFSRSAPRETLEAILHADVPRIDAVRTETPEAFALAIHRALDRDPDARFATARDLAEAVRASLGSAPSDPDVVAHFLERVRAERIVQLEARIREAVAAPEVRTLADIDLPPVESLPYDETVKARTPPSGEAETRLLRDAAPAHAETVTVVQTPGDEHLDTTVARAPRRARRPTAIAAVVAIGAVALAVWLLAGLGSTSEAPRARAPGPVATPAETTAEPPLSDAGAVATPDDEDPGTSVAELPLEEPPPAATGRAATDTDRVAEDATRADPDSQRRRRRRPPPSKQPERRDLLVDEVFF